VRAGAIVPEAPPMQYSNQKPLDPLIVNVFPLASGQISTYTLYEDAGDSTAYQQGADARTEIRATEDNDVLLVGIAAAKGTYQGMPAARAYQIRLPADWPPALVMVNGRTLNRTTQKGSSGWRFEGNTLTTVIDIPSMPVNQPVTVRVARSAELFSRRSELDGFAGAMTRLREAYDALNQTWPIAWSTDELIDAMQTGDRLSYFPQQAAELLAHYGEVLPKAIAKAKEFNRPPSQVQVEALAKRFNVDPNSDLVQKKVAEFKDRVARAEAALANVRNPQ
jgi:alpha-glucosidase